MTAETEIEAQKLAEIPENPFENLAIDSPDEQLAFAEIWQQILEHQDDEDSRDTEVLEHQLDRVTYYLGQRFKGYEKFDKYDPPIAELKRRDTELIEQYGIQEYDLNTGKIIANYANAARWRLSDIDQTKLAEHAKDGVTRENMEQIWGEAAEAKRTADIAALKAQIAALEVKRQEQVIATGKSVDYPTAEQATLRGMIERLEPIAQGSNGSGWSGGNYVG